MPEDLIKFGLIPEFIGRLPVVATVEDLDRGQLIEILTVPKNALTKQYSRMLEMDGVELSFTSGALEAVADLAIKRGTGARGLRAILEEVLLNTMFDLPSRNDVASVMIDERVVREKANPTLVPLQPPKERSA
jgi:ATP-dependent Clp protease ATP-binding subunit ClpX